MTDERALAINRLLVTAYMLREGFSEEPLPDVWNFTQQEAVAASELMLRRKLGRTRNADGSLTILCHVAPDAVPSLLAWVDHQRASDRLDRRSAAA